MKKNDIYFVVARMVLAAAAIVFIVLSMILNKTQPYLAIGLAFIAIANTINWMRIGQKKGRRHGSAEDR